MKRKQIAPHKLIIAEYLHLRAHPGVVSVGIGRKETKRKLTGRLCVKIYVQKKYRKRTLPHDELPKSTTILVPIGRGLYRSRRVPTDIIEMSDVVFANSPTLLHPVVPSGSQIGFVSAIAGFGTCGAVVRHRSTGEVVTITAGHVVADPGTNNISPNRLVYQPQPPAHRETFVFARTRGGFIGDNLQAGGFVDIALLANVRNATNATWDSQIPAPVGVMSTTQVVSQRIGIVKVGASTLRTVGAFSAFHASLEPRPGLLLRNVLEFVNHGTVLGDRGDSGALVLSSAPNQSGFLIGVLFATSPDKERILVIPWERIETFFNIGLI
jgi:hypothetical protein